MQQFLFIHSMQFLFASPIYILLILFYKSNLNFNSA